MKNIYTIQINSQIKNPFSAVIRCFFLLFLFLIFFNNTNAASRFWVGGAGNWSDINHWSATTGGSGGSPVPGSADAVTFDATGLSSGTVSIDIAANCNTLTFNSAGGNLFLSNTLTCVSSITLTTGTINTNSYRVNATGFISTGAAARTLNLGSSTLNLSATLGNTAWNMNGSLILTGGTSTINFSGASGTFTGFGKTYYNVNFTNAGATATIASNNTFNNVSFTGNGTITGNNTFNNLTFSAGKTYSFGTFFSSTSVTETIHGIFTANGTCTSMITIQMNMANTGGATIVSSNNVKLNYVTLTGITGTQVSGVPTYAADNSNDGGNNVNWAFSSGADLYWISGTGNWSDPNHWSTISGNASGITGCIPNGGNNVHFDANSFSAAGQTVTIDVDAYCKNMDWTGVTNTPSFVGADIRVLSILGSLTFVPGMSVTAFTSQIMFKGTTTGLTISTAGLTLPANLSGSPNIYFNGVGGSWTLSGPLTTTGKIYDGNGTLNTNGQTLNALAFVTDVTGAPTVNMGASTFNLSLDGATGAAWQGSSGNAIINAGTSIVNFTGIGAQVTLNGITYYDVNFTAASASPAILYNNKLSTCTFHNVTFAGSGQFGGYPLGLIKIAPTFNNLTLSAGYTYSFSPGVTNTINGILTANGTCTSLITIQSNTPGSQTTFNSPTNNVLINYCSLQDINAAVTGVTYTAVNSIDVSDNTNWLFTGGNGTVAVNVTAAPGATICPGTKVTFSATPANGGTIPAYQWKVNGKNVGTDSSGFSSSTLNNNDSITCTLTSNSPCVTGPLIVTSVPIVITVGNGQADTVKANPPSICSGQSSALTVTGNTGYTWFPSTGLNKTTGNAVIATPAITTTYTVVAGAGNCSFTNTVVVSVANIVGGHVTAIRDTICKNTTGGLTLTNNSDSTIQWQSSIDNVHFTDVSGAIKLKYNTLPLAQSTWYRATVGTGNCSAFSDTLKLYVPPVLTASFYSTQMGMNELSFNSDSSLGSIRSYHWDFGDNSTSDSSNPIHTFPKDTTYYVCLTLYDGSNCSYTFCRYQSVVTGIPTVSAFGNFIIYPNPFGNNIFIDPSTELRVTGIEIYNVLGEKLLDKRRAPALTGTIQLDVSNLTNGVYELRIVTETENYLQKLIKLK